MVDCLIEIPLPGRTFGSPSAKAAGCPAGTTLPSFVAGPENRLVAMAILQVLEACRAVPDEQSLASGRGAAVGGHGAAATLPHIISLYGESGTGKTHLAHGAVHWWQEHCGPESAAYMTAGDFRRRLTEAYDADEVAEFRRQTRSRRLLAIEDLHRLPAHENVQHELRYTIDACEASGSWLLVTSSRAVTTLASLLPDVRSRLCAGLVLPLTAPSVRARRRIVEHAATALGWPLAQDAAARLAAGVCGTASDLFGALFALHAAVPQSESWNTEYIDRYLADHEPRRPPLREIVAVVARYYGIPQKLLRSGTRRHSTVSARGAVVYLARQLARASYERIGHVLGGRDHTTVIHSYRKIHRQLQHDPAVREALADLHRLLLAREKSQ